MFCQTLVGNVQKSLSVLLESNVNGAQDEELNMLPQSENKTDLMHYFTCCGQKLRGNKALSQNSHPAIFSREVYSANKTH